MAAQTEESAVAWGFPLDFYSTLNRNPEELFI